jgi:hypothetical protein
MNNNYNKFTTLPAHKWWWPNLSTPSSKENLSMHNIPKDFELDFEHIYIPFYYKYDWLKN